MMENHNTSKRLQGLLPKLSKDQLRFVVASQEYPSKKAAAIALDIKPNTVYAWPDIVDEVVDLLALDIAESARDMLTTSAVKAAMVKIAGLDSEDENVRQRAATEIIDRAIGKVQQKIDHTTKGEKIKITDEEHNRTISTLADAIGDSIHRASAEK